MLCLKLAGHQHGCCPYCRRGVDRLFFDYEEDGFFRRFIRPEALDEEGDEMRNGESDEDGDDESDEDEYEADEEDWTADDGHEKDGTDAGDEDEDDTLSELSFALDDLEDGYEAVTLLAQPQGSMQQLIVLRDKNHRQLARQKSLSGTFQPACQLVLASALGTVFGIMFVFALAFAIASTLPPPLGLVATVGTQANACQDQDKQLLSTTAIRSLSLVVLAAMQRLYAFVWTLVQSI